MSRLSKPVAVSVGCPAGVGPEVAVRAATRIEGVPCLLVGDGVLLREAARRVRVAQRRLVDVDEPRATLALPRGHVGIWERSASLRRAVEPGRATPAAGAAQLRWLEQATELVRDGACAALTTGPISKKAVASSGLPKAARFRGHTEWLAERLAAREVVMAFTAGGDRAAKRPALTTALVTTHVPLARVAESITPAGVAAASFWLAELLVRLGYRTPHVVVAALNPHAGEEGLLGDEERRVIRPGIRRARRRLARRGLSAELTGPVGAETAFRRCVAGDYHGVVAMYHDQATIPCKLLGFGEAVNVSLGLPIVRTSVDHGTGYDIAGTGRASSAGMERAVQLAARLAAR